MMSMPTLYMLVGVPGSGKSTWINHARVQKGHNTIVLSTDYYIDVVATLKGKTYNEVFEETIQDAERKVRKDLEWAIENKANIIWDQTNLNRKTRARKLSSVPKTYHKVAVVFPTPDSAEHERRLNSRRGKTIPKSVMDSMINSFQYPSTDEGFDEVCLYTELVREDAYENAKSV